MKRRNLIKGMAAALPALWLSRALGNNIFEEQLFNEPIAPGPFEPTWESLQKYQTPDWFRDAKFGIWAHWGPQSAIEAGDWRIEVALAKRARRPMIVLDALFIRPASTLSGYVAVYIEFLFYTDEWEIFEWSGLSTEVALMDPALEADLPMVTWPQ